MTDAWTRVQTETREAALLRGASAALQWDQQTYMPKGAGPLRGAQLAALSGLLHRRFTADGFVGDVREAAATASDPFQKRAAGKLLVDVERATKVPESLVRRTSEAEASGFAAWMAAREAADFSIFAPHLQTALDLAKERAAAIDGDRHPLQVLMEPADPGIQLDSLAETLARLQTGLTELIGRVPPGEDRDVTGNWPLPAQSRLHEEVASALGYDLEHGRLDQAQHPFTIGLGHGDTRITTHLYEDDLLGGLGGTVHEAGHALYEQGLPAAWAGSGLDEAASLGLHESQSRFWENAIGRSLPFFEWLMPKLDAHFPHHGTSADALFRAANQIRPGLIRVTADEVTYNLHIIIRVELELALFEGRLDVADLPAAWNDKYASYLGVRPANDTEGVLQDVHWSGGAFAYFQSYTLGNLYAASLNAVLREQMPDLDDKVRTGDFEPILGWLRTHIHQHGRHDTGEERVLAVTGPRDRVADLLDHLWSRHGALYGLSRC